MMIFFQYGLAIALILSRLCECAGTVAVTSSEPSESVSLPLQSLQEAAEVLSDGSSRMMRSEAPVDARRIEGDAKKVKDLQEATTAIQEDASEAEGEESKALKAAVTEEELRDFANSTEDQALDAEQGLSGPPDESDTGCFSGSVSRYQCGFRKLPAITYTDPKGAPVAVKGICVSKRFDCWHPCNYAHQAKEYGSASQVVSYIRYTLKACSTYQRRQVRPSSNGGSAYGQPAYGNSAYGKSAYGNSAVSSSAYGQSAKGRSAPRSAQDEAKLLSAGYNLESDDGIIFSSRKTAASTSPSPGSSTKAKSSALRQHSRLGLIVTLTAVFLSFTF
eukprot:TRINITY_DN5769_c1_g4_i1.p1 TRINITY_DN5769_c1_g4~~TRINITY_DN5769_c1_g4_i1.p1  ORF type:complete len:333 (+),score=49.11 TRINITY_DN5769_c1_g4_i1:87-1085(+)